MSERPSFNVTSPLNVLVPGAMYQGSFLDHTKEEYEKIQWLDHRDKPKWIEIESIGVELLRALIVDNINQNTTQGIETQFRYSKSKELIHADMEWQFDTLNLWINRDNALIEYPYQLHIGGDATGAPRYIDLENSKDLEQLYLEMFGHVNSWLNSGRAERGKIQSLSRTALEEYLDPRKLESVK